MTGFGTRMVSCVAESFRCRLSAIWDCYHSKRYLRNVSYIETPVDR